MVQPESRRSELIAAGTPSWFSTAMRWDQTSSYLFSPPREPLQPAAARLHDGVVGPLRGRPGQGSRRAWLQLLHRGMERGVLPRVRLVVAGLPRCHRHPVRDVRDRRHSGPETRRYRSHLWRGGGSPGDELGGQPRDPVRQPPRSSLEDFVAASSRRDSVPEGPRPTLGCSRRGVLPSAPTHWLFCSGARASRSTGWKPR